MHIGFIGLGHMGRAMASTLLRAGYTLTVYNRTRTKAADLEQAGARVASSPKEAARDADVVITMLSDDEAVEVLDAGEAAAVPMPIASVLRDRFIDAIAHGLSSSDWSAVARPKAGKAAA